MEMKRFEESRVRMYCPVMLRGGGSNSRPSHCECEQVDIDRDGLVPIEIYNPMNLNDFLRINLSLPLIDIPSLPHNLVTWRLHGIVDL